jgi:hypothetical protein
MRAIGGVFLLAALTFGVGCAKSDWIERTLVTVDVTGTWYGSVGGAGRPGVSSLWFELEQQGSTVKGSMKSDIATYGVATQQIDGTVAGDVFRFKQRDGNVVGEVTVSGDEMTGQGSFAGSSRSLSLRRVDPSSRPPR